MRHLLIITISFCFSFYSTASQINSLAYPGSPYPVTAEKTLKFQYSNLLKLKIKELEKIAGRKFSLKEKIGIMMLKQHLKKGKMRIPYADVNPGQQATHSFIAGLLTIGVLIPALFNVFTGVALFVVISVLGLLALWFGLRSARSGKNFKNMFGIIVGGLVLIGGIIIGISALTAF